MSFTFPGLLQAPSSSLLGIFVRAFSRRMESGVQYACYFFLSGDGSVPMQPQFYETWVCLTSRYFSREEDSSQGKGRQFFDPSSSLAKRSLAREEEDRG